MTDGSDTGSNAEPDPRPDAGAFGDLAAYTSLARTTAIALSCDGARLVAAVQAPDGIGSRYVSSLWEVPLDGGEPARLTRSDPGESAPVFAPDGDLLFVSARPGPGVGGGDDTALWSLPRAGEPAVAASRPGGLTGPVVAATTGDVVVAGSVLIGSREDDDADRRAVRKDRGISAILHAGMPIRFWDHEVGDVSPRLYLLDAATGDCRDLAPDAGPALMNADYSVSADGATVATTWREAAPRGRFPYGVALIDTATGDRTVLLSEIDVDYQLPRIAPDGSLVAVLRESIPTYAEPWAWSLQVVDRDVRVVDCDLADLFPTGWVWSADSSVLYVSGDLHGRGGVVAVDPTTGAVARRLAIDAVYTDLHVSPDGTHLYALRSAYDCAPRPVTLDVRLTEQQPRYLSDPAPLPPLPGRMVELSVPHGGADVHAWLCLPTASPASAAPAPAPVMTWVHGGPFMSANSWSWRWNPWVAVAHGWAVVLPDPALSTGYGRDCIERAWPYRADVVWAEVQAVLDAVLERPDTDASKTALLGGSFGGFMANWIAGHSDRFGAIVAHAGLWAADQQHTTTDGAAFKTGLFGRPDDHPEWYDAYSPHHFLSRIRTPMLVSHGNRDYRVPVGESLRLWWDLVESWTGAPEDLPHRFLQFTGENHWVLKPANAEIWWHTVLGFCGHHVLGEPWTQSPLL